MRTKHIIGIALIGLTGCRGIEAKLNATTTSQDKGAAAMTQKLNDVEALKALIGIDMTAFVERYQIQPDEIRPHVRYQGMTDVVNIHSPRVSPAQFYFRNGKLALVYMSDPATLRTVNSDAMKTQHGGDAPGFELRSRAGKTSNLHVFASRGFAFSSGDEIEFYEIFAPTTEEEYKRDIYVEVTPFVK